MSSVKYNIIPDAGYLLLTNKGVPGLAPRTLAAVVLVVPLVTHPPVPSPLPQPSLHPCCCPLPTVVPLSTLLEHPRPRDRLSRG